MKSNNKKFNFGARDYVGHYRVSLDPLVQGFRVTNLNNGLINKDSYLFRGDAVKKAKLLYSQYLYDNSKAGLAKTKKKNKLASKKK